MGTNENFTSEKVFYLKDYQNFQEKTRFIWVGQIELSRVIKRCICGASSKHATSQKALYR